MRSIPRAKSGEKDTPLSSSRCPSEGPPSQSVEKQVSSSQEMQSRSASVGETPRRIPPPARGRVLFQKSDNVKDLDVAQPDEKKPPVVSSPPYAFSSVRFSVDVLQSDGGSTETATEPGQSHSSADASHQNITHLPRKETSAAVSLNSSQKDNDRGSTEVQAKNPDAAFVVVPAGSSISTALNFFRNLENQDQNKNTSTRSTSLPPFSKANFSEAAKRYSERKRQRENLDLLNYTEKKQEDVKPKADSKVKERPVDGLSTELGQPTVVLHTVKHTHGVATVYDSRSTLKRTVSLKDMHAVTREKMATLTLEASSDDGLHKEANIQEDSKKSVAKSDNVDSDESNIHQKLHCDFNPVAHNDYVEHDSTESTDLVHPPPNLNAADLITQSNDQQPADQGENDSKSVEARIAALMSMVKKNVEPKPSNMMRSPKPITNSKISALKHRLFGEKRNSSLPSFSEDEEEEELSVHTPSGPLESLNEEDEEKLESVTEVEEEEERPMIRANTNPRVHCRSVEILDEWKFEEGMRILRNLRSENKINIRAVETTLAAITEVSTRTTASPRSIMNTSSSLRYSPFSPPVPISPPVSEQVDMSLLLARNVPPSRDDDSDEELDTLLNRLKDQSLSGEEHLAVCRSINEHMLEFFERETMLMRSAGIRTLELITNEMRSRQGQEDPEFDPLETTLLTAIANVEYIIQRRLSGEQAPGGYIVPNGNPSENMDVILREFHPFLEMYDENMRRCVALLDLKLTLYGPVSSPPLHPDPLPAVESPSSELLSKTGSYTSTNSSESNESQPADESPSSELLSKTGSYTSTNSSESNESQPADESPSSELLSKTGSYTSTNSSESNESLVSPRLPHANDVERPAIVPMNDDLLVGKAPSMDTASRELPRPDLSTKSAPKAPRSVAVSPLEANRPAAPVHFLPKSEMPLESSGKARDGCQTGAQLTVTTRLVAPNKLDPMNKEAKNPQNTDSGREEDEKNACEGDRSMDESDRA